MNYSKLIEFYKIDHQWGLVGFNKISLNRSTVYFDVKKVPIT